MCSTRSRGPRVGLGAAIAAISRYYRSITGGIRAPNGLGLPVDQFLRQTQPRLSKRASSTSRRGTLTPDTPPVSNSSNTSASAVSSVWRRYRETKGPSATPDLFSSGPLLVSATSMAKNVNREFVFTGHCTRCSPIAGFDERVLLRARQESHGMLLWPFDPVLKIWSERPSRVARCNRSREFLAVPCPCRQYDHLTCSRGSQLSTCQRTVNRCQRQWI